MDAVTITNTFGPFMVSLSVCSSYYQSELVLQSLDITVGLEIPTVEPGHAVTVHDINVTAVS